MVSERLLSLLLSALRPRGEGERERERAGEGEGKILRTEGSAGRGLRGEIGWLVWEAMEGVQRAWGWLDDRITAEVHWLWRWGSGTELTSTPCTRGLPFVDSPAPIVVAVAIYLTIVVGGLLWINANKLKPREKEPWPLQALVLVHNLFCFALSLYMCVGIVREAIVNKYVTLVAVVTSLPSFPFGIGVVGIPAFGVAVFEFSQSQVEIRGQLVPPHMCREPPMHEDMALLVAHELNLILVQLELYRSWVWLRVSGTLVSDWWCFGLGMVENLGLCV